jgi:hypothetical protein
MNAFLTVADNQQNAASKARDRGRERRLAKLVVPDESHAPMVASASDKQAFENSVLMKRYRQALANRRQELLNGPHGREVKGLLQLLDNLTASSAAALVLYVSKARWLTDADRNTRFDVLAIVGTAIARLRVRSGLLPFDDSLPYMNEAPTAFEQIRKLLTGVGATI